MDGEQLRKVRENVSIGNHRVRVTKTPLQGNEKNTIKQPALWVHLELSFKDPEEKTRYFPKGFKVDIVWGNNQQKRIRETVDNGVLRFIFFREDAAKYKFFRLYFSSVENNHFICEKRGEQETELICESAAKADEEAKKGNRFFSLPSEWSMLTSDWSVSADEKIYDNAEKEKKFLFAEDDLPRSIGTRENPVQVILDPHWQYVKYEFFDRYYGHSDHKDKPISIPPITVEGLVETARITRSNWTISPSGDEKEIIQCVPWILQAKADGTAKPRPDKDSLLQFKQPKNTFIWSKSETERILDENFPIDKVGPCALRLKYYDLPELWQSKNYWSRLSDNKDEQGFFEKMADKETTKSKPLIFSLDDIVLTDDKITPIEMRDTDKVVLFYHEFLDPVSARNKKGTGGRAGAKYYKNGLYKPGLNLVEAKAAAAKMAEAAEKSKIIDEMEENISDDVINSRIESAKADASLLADAPLLAQVKAEDKQRVVEENEVRKNGEETARRLIERKARREGKNEDEIRRAVEDRARLIKNFGETKLKSLQNDVEAQKRIEKAGKEAEEAATVFPYSDVPRYEEVPNYISDYPHWTRLVIANGNLFDNFDKRTNSGDVIGTRAAVRLLDATPSGVGVAPGTIVEKMPEVKPAKGQQEQAYFILQPFYQQNFMEHSWYHQTRTEPYDMFLGEGIYDEWEKPLPKHKHSIGRSELGLLRSSNYSGTNDEEAVVFAYHRANFDFTGKSEFGIQLPDNHSTVQYPKFPFPIRIVENRTAHRYKWIENFLVDCANRWNGNDYVNRNRAWIQEKKDENPKFRAQVVTFLQYLPPNEAHFKISVEDDGKGWLSTSGEGSFDTRDGRDTEIEGAHFGGAHEYGHAGGQPDDYALTDNRQLGFGSFNVPGAPFDLDEKAMMKSNKQVRARSFWHITEWLRGLKPFSNSKFQVLHNRFNYEVPAYNHIDRFPGRNYAHWAVKANVFHQPAPPVSYDSFLYFLGDEEFKREQGDADGIMVILIKTKVEFTGYTDKADWKKFLLELLNKKINEALNKPRVYARFSLNGIDRGGEPTFKKCMLHFSPRFDVDKASENEAHLKLIIETPDPSDPIHRWATKIRGHTGISNTESEIHGKLNSKNFTEIMPVIRRESGTDLWSAPQPIKDWEEFKIQFEDAGLPRELIFRFPPKPVSNDDSDQHDQFVTPRLQNVFFKHICQMLGLSSDAKEANYYQNADAYKSIVQACVNDDKLDLTMSRL